VCFINEIPAPDYTLHYWYRLQIAALPSGKVLMITDDSKWFFINHFTEGLF
jgi:hypothetical protein